jgi:hypothetical protein
MSGLDPVQYGISRANTCFIVVMEFLLTPLKATFSR